MELNEQANIIENKEKPVELSEFKKRCDKDPEFRAKHNAKMSEGVECECGCLITRSNMSTHKKNPKHAKLMAVKEKSNAVIRAKLIKNITKQFNDMWVKIPPEMRIEVLKGTLKIK